MIPILYQDTETSFTSLGIGALADASSCTVEEELNGSYELALTYPVEGRRFKDIQERMIIKAKPSPNQNDQPFRIYWISQPMMGEVEIKARHLSYDLSGYVAQPFSDVSLPSALDDLKNSCIPACPFTFDTDKQVSRPYQITIPTTARSVLGGMAGSILDIFGGEYSFDGWNVFLNNHRGHDRGVSIRYGKNLTNFVKEISNENVYTAVFPYYQSDETGLITLPEKTVPVDGVFDFERVMPLDLSSEFEETPTEEEIRARTESYIAGNNLAVPDTSWDIDFEQMAVKGESTVLLERVDLGDSVTVVYPKWGVKASSRVVKTAFNVLLERYTVLTLGTVKANLSTSLAVIEKEVKQKPSVSMTEAISNSLTKALLGAKGGTVRLIDTDQDGEPDTLYIADNPDPTLAQNVWRWNSAGWAVSNNGYDGDYIMGATVQDGLLANFVTSAHLTAGTIQSQDGQSFYLNLDTGEFRAGASNVLVNGQPIGDTITSISENTEEALQKLNSMSDYISYASGVLTLGDVTANVKMTLENDGLKFINTQTGDVIAYFTNNKLHTYDGIDVGNNWEITTDNGYSIRWKGDD